MRHSISPRGWTNYFFHAVLILLLPAVARAAGELADPIKVDGGRVSGAVVGKDPAVHVYKGIPFAAPPTGKLRWKPPAPVVPWEGVRTCSDYSAGCSQPRSPIPMPGLNPPKMSEDCLYLNVWTPAQKMGEKLPVMVWIHGGGFAMGAAGVDIYDGEALARKGVVVVTINYRLGPFGFLAHPLLSKESEHNSSGNYGLLDQIEALKWVQANIKSFGGDPKRVTIFGESAGGVSVAMLMVTPLSEGLFQRAIAESGSVSLFPMRHVRESWNGTEPMENSGIDLAKNLGCKGAPNELEIMRSKSDEEILAASEKVQIDANKLFSGKTFPYWPIVDGWVIPEDPSDVVQSGRCHKIPFMIGTNADEGSIFTAAVPARQPSDYEGLVRVALKDDADKMLKLHPASETAQIKAALNQLVTAAMFVAPARTMCRGMEAAGVKTFCYHFTKTHATGFGSNMGAHHAAEIPYVFGNLNGMKVGDAADAVLCEKMMTYWTRFAATGNPNAKGLPSWPVYTAAKDEYLQLGETVEAKTGLRKADCDLVDEITAKWRADKLKTSKN